MLEINGKPAVEFIKEAYGVHPSGEPRYDLDDPVQTELRQIRDWITMAERDALKGRKRPG